MASQTIYLTDYIKTHMTHYQTEQWYTISDGRKDIQGLVVTHNESHNDLLIHVAMEPIT